MSDMLHDRVPEVSVVVISYNDAERLVRAIASVQRQTLRNLEIIVVDDASTDSTADVVADLAALDPRIRYACLEQNSGGCSAPRNRGLALARAPWIMFCDSDDEYERHACKNLLLAAERHDADVACGKAVRVDSRSGKHKDWRPELHDCVQSAEGLAAYPELLYDTISVNKIYRRALIEQHALRFPEGLLFEDQLFTLQAMALSRCVVSIPEVVYYWYVDRLSEDLSITQRRVEERNVDSRIEVNRLIDAFLAEHGLDDLRKVKDIKFLRHDLHLYFVSILESDDETAHMLMEHLAPYVRTLDLRAAWSIRPLSRVAIYHLLVGDLVHLRSAMRFLRWASVVDTPVIAADGRQLWGCGHALDGAEVAAIPAAEWLDVNELDLLGVPFVDRRYAHIVTHASSSTGEYLEIAGTTVDYAGDLDPSVDHMEIQARTGGGAVMARCAVQWTAVAEGRVQWRTSGPWTTTVRRALRPSDKGSLALVITRDALVNVTAVRGRAADLAATDLAFPGTLEPGRPRTLVLGQQEYGALGWRAGEPAPEPQGILGRGARAIRSRIIEPASARLGSRASRTSVVLADCEGGRPPQGRIAAIAAAVAEYDSAVQVVWVDRDDSMDPPPGHGTVLRGSPEHARLAARCRAYLTDGACDRVDGVGGAVVMTGTAPRLAREGLDDPSTVVDRAAVRQVRARARWWDIALASGEADGRALVSSMGFAGPVHCVGTPEVASAEKSLGLPTDRPTVVWAPARRDAGVVPDFDPDAWASALGRECFLVIAAAPGSGIDIPTRLRAFIRLDTARTPDYVSAARLVVGDYGPAVPWSVAVEAPMVAYLPDEADFVRRRHGLYADVRSLAPVARDMGELVVLVRERLHQQALDPGIAAARAAYRVDWCGDAVGPAACGAAVSVVLGAVQGARA